MSDRELASKLKLMVKKERHLTAEIITHLREVESRKLALKWGYSGLFNYLVHGLGYSEACAYQRIATLKVCQGIDDREISDKLESGHSA